ncbi:hypothetical protein CWI38_0549p0010 [Hamiltosporidium tvaerminnensis]|uniref:Uncharacterized protein n=1 Tax=Hamiltosporidium tvaerminnensis TaxID=1176355 RepID=A0A4Q9L5L9_9MICR|nr:hypothetical protein CWI37_0546p0010 [Hamiltosporidium tvaerminnensis]TBU13044.1 hypothetical protein CWI38_0549p0010 [Hamiltosporidium tvaerminnensis]
MSFWRTKTFRISTIIVLGLIIVGLLIGGIGYYKATNAIKDSERDFKNVSKTEQFKNHLSKFKRKHSIKDIYNAVKIFDNELNRQLNFKQRTFLVLEIIDVKNIIVYKLHMKHGENTFLGVSTSLTFESLKINDEVYYVSDFITYIAEKVYKEATTDAILNEFKKIFNINA